MPSADLRGVGAPRSEGDWSGRANGNAEGEAAPQILQLQGELLLFVGKGRRGGGWGGVTSCPKQNPRTHTHIQSARALQEETRGGFLPDDDDDVVEDVDVDTMLLFVSRFAFAQ